MKITVFVTPVDGNGFKARAQAPYGFVAQGTTREEALQKMRTVIGEQIHGEPDLVPMDLNPNHPWSDFIGTWSEDEPVIAEWKKEVEAYRREVDEDADAP